MRPVHIVTAFSRFHLLETLIQHYRPMNIIWHPVVFASEFRESDWPDEAWILPFVAADAKGSKDTWGNHKKNAFIHSGQIHANDYYWILDDDDMAPKATVDVLREMSDDVVVISLQRGYHIPPNVIPERRYGTSPLIAHPAHMVVGKVSQQQYICKGWVFEQTNLIEEDDIQTADGIVIEWLAKHFRIRYEPEIVAWFNYFEPGRWDNPERLKIGFGVMVNDIGRLDMCLRQSSLDPRLIVNTVKLPESATQGLNKLLGILEEQGHDIGILVHQDMFFRQGWTEQVLDQIEFLPSSWVVAGPIGKDMEGNVRGKFHDMRLPLHFYSDDLPLAASCFDEAVLIINLKKKFRFDETMDGFDLYGTLVVLQAWEMGGTAWIIDAFCEHYCMRPFTWVPDGNFSDHFRWLHQRFPQAERIDTTVLGVRKKDSRRRYDLPEDNLYIDPKFPSYQDDYDKTMMEGRDATVKEECRQSV